MIIDMFGLNKRILEPILFLLGTLITLLGVLFIRAWKVILPLMTPEQSQWVVASNNNTFLNAFPPTMLFGLSLVGVGAFIQGLSYRAAKNILSRHEPVSLFEKQESHLNRKATIFSLVAITLTAVIFHDGEYWGKNTSLWAPFFFLIWCALVIYAFSKLIRSSRRSEACLSKLEFVGLIVGSALILAFYASDLNSYRYAFIGDEYGFFYLAEQFKAIKFRDVAWLSARGPDNWPISTAVWQALFMCLTGDHNFWWRFSMSVLTALCLIPFYLLCKNITKGIGRSSQIISLFGCACFFFSELIIVWARIGKPHAPFLFPVILTLYFYFEAQARNSKLLLFLAGFSCGFGIFLGPFGPMVAGGCLFSLCAFDMLRSLYQRRLSFSSAFSIFFVVLGGAVLGSGPILFQFDYFQHLFSVTIVSAEAQRNQALFYPRTLQTTLLFFSYRSQSHFMSGNVVDPFTAFLVAQALGARRLIGGRVWFSVLLILITMGFLVGGCAQYPYPPETRILLVMIPISLLSMIGIASLVNFCSSFGRLIVFCLSVVCTVYNIAKLENFNPYQRMVHYFVAELQEVQIGPPDLKHILIFSKNPVAEFKDRGWLNNFVKIFRLEDRVHVLEDDENLESALTSLLEKRGTKFVVRTTTDLPNETRIKEIARSYNAEWGSYVGSKYLVEVQSWDRKLEKPFLELMKKIE
jgi:hypothetical protein